VTALVDAYAAAVVADRALAQSRPPVIRYVVAGPISLYVLAADLYGAALARQKATEIAQLNRLPDPLWIPAGTELRLARPTT
jgi:hypothetical protein